MFRGWEVRMLGSKDVCTIVDIIGKSAHSLIEFHT